MLRLIFGPHGLIRRFKWNETGAPILSFTFLMSFIIMVIIFYTITVGEWMYQGWVNLDVAVGVTKPK